MTAGLLITSLEGQINFINEPGVRILNLPVERLLGMQIGTLFIEQIDMPRVMQTLKTTKLVSIERNLMQEKRAAMIGMSISYLHSQKGAPTGFMIIFQDITESRKMERQYRLQERMAAIGTMAAGIAHEIRNPLASIRGSVQLLKSELHLNEDQEKLMNIVLTESTRLDQTIRNFLNYAKPKQVTRSSENLKSLVHDMLEFIKKGPETRNDHEIEFESGGEDFHHEIDPDQIKQVIWNLSINALRSMPAGGKLRVTLQHDHHGDILLAFSDAGRGIEPERLDSIFDPFQESTTGGSGLGMAIVYRIIEDHHGQIHVDSALERGTTVTIKLPLHSQFLQPLLQ
jgi:two-component system, NtrC family, sensor histidine kinase PilS